MKICYFGTYDKKRPRNRIIIEGLRKNGIEVIECHFSVWGNIEDKSQVRSFLAKLKICFKFIISHIVLSFKYMGTREHDAILVGYMGHFDMFIAKPLAMIRRKRVYFDAFLSLYDTIVFDRKLIKKQNPLSGLLYFIDKTSCRLADKVFLDTNAQINYFAQTFKLKKDKFRRIFIGGDENLFYPKSSAETSEQQEKFFNVLFYGQFTPLHGVRYIIKAAQILAREKDIKFTFIGQGQEYAKMKNMARELGLTNITWLGWIRHEEILDYIAASEVCLGIFGDTEKASRVIPNKAFEIIASKKPLVTGDSQASRELFTDKKDAVFCAMADPESIARSILLLKNDISLRNGVAEKGYELFIQKCSIKKTGEQTLSAILK